MAILHISDGSELTLGSQTQSTVLNFETLEYKDDSNLFSRIGLFLRSGETVVKVPDLHATSDYSVRSDAVVATVRGTVFIFDAPSPRESSITLAV